MMTFAELLTEDMRLVVLKALAEDAGYEHNENILQTILDQFGHRISRDRLRTELAWLEEQGLVQVREVMDCRIAALTGRGADVAAGAATIPGVKRPRPRG